jgi:hypothetical protein
MKELSIEKMEMVSGKGNDLAAFACGLGIVGMLFQPTLAIAIGEVTLGVCAIAYKSYN